MNTKKELFTPSQPSVKVSEEDIAYHEIFPNEKLSNHIYGYWQLKSKKPLSELFLYRAVADGCFEIITECKSPYNSHVMGLSTTYNIFPLGYSFNYIGIRFLPTAFPSIFNINASELTNRVEELSLVLPKISQQIGHIIYDNSILEELKDSFDSYFLKFFSKLSNNHDKRLHSAINTIFHSKGNLAVKDLDVGLSARQLRRLFEFNLGDTPKVFSKIVRFQSLLKSIPLYDTLRKNNFYYDYGFYDQAHYIKDFKTFYGLSPLIAFV